jgi:hypothetical protein
MEGHQIEVPRYVLGSKCLVFKASKFCYSKYMVAWNMYVNFIQVTIVLYLKTNLNLKGPCLTL